MSDLLTQNNIYPLTVVIATLGGKTLTKTIEKLNHGTIIPSEILLCIPERESKRVEYLLTENVKIVITQCRGQVAQRAVGFQQASNDYVLQLDDDIYVNNNCLKSLINCISGNNKTAVGPKLYDINTGRYHSFMTAATNDSSWINKLLFWVVNGSSGYEPGKISKSGINMGLLEDAGNWVDIDWLPGGCVLHYKDNLFLYDFYPFKGKAFAEDLYHSILLKNNGIRLKRCDDAICNVDFSSDVGFNIIEFVKSYFKYTRAMTRLAKGSYSRLPRLYCSIVLIIINNITRKLLKF